MTYKEQWELENPGKSWVDEHTCPKNFYGTLIKCPTSGDCMDCWNREIPEKAASEGLLAGVNAVIPEVAEAAKNMARSASKAVCDAFGPTIKDSGDRTEFETGAVRDMREGKGRCDLMPLEVVSRYLGEEGFDPVIDHIATFLKTNNTHCLYNTLSYFDEGHWDNCCTMMLEVAKHFEEGAKKYGPDNWRKGIPVHCYIDSAIRHYLKWLRGDTDEPHDRAFVWNIMCCIWEVDHHEKKETPDASKN